MARNPAHLPLPTANWQGKHQDGKKMRTGPLTSRSNTTLSSMGTESSYVSNASLPPPDEVMEHPTMENGMALNIDKSAYPLADSNASVFAPPPARGRDNMGGGLERDWQWDTMQSSRGGGGEEGRDDPMDCGNAGQQMFGKGKRLASGGSTGTQSSFDRLVVSPSGNAGRSSPVTPAKSSKGVQKRLKVESRADSSGSQTPPGSRGSHGSMGGLSVVGQGLG